MRAKTQMFLTALIVLLIIVTAIIFAFYREDVSNIPKKIDSIKKEFIVKEKERREESKKEIKKPQDIVVIKGNKINISNDYEAKE